LPHIFEAVNDLRVAFLPPICGAKRHTIYFLFTDRISAAEPKLLSEIRMAKLSLDLP
jgi:hypothetical protein